MFIFRIAINKSKNMKIKFVLLVILYALLGFNKIEQSCEECSFILEPIGAVNLILQDEKSKVLNSFDSCSIINNGQKDTLGIVCYDCTKKIKLVKGKSSKIEGRLGFKDNKLVYFDVEIFIGSNSNYYFNYAIPIFKEKNVNAFLVSEPDFYNSEVNDKCRKSLVISRGSTPNKFYIKVKCSSR